MSGPRVIGVDAGGTKLLCGVLDEDLVVHHRALRTWGNEGREGLLDTIAATVEEALEAVPDAAAIGLGIPSLVERSSGASLSSVHLPLDDVPFLETMRARFDLPLVVENDATAAVVGEQRHGAAVGARDVVLLTLGTGIGGGLLLDGRVYRGSRGVGGELGHVVVDLDGPECFGDCPGKGCLEAVASGQAIARDATVAARAAPDSELGSLLAGGQEITGLVVTEAALAGDATARAVLEQVGHRLGAGITGLVNAFNPELVVVGGGVMAAGELLLGPARDVVARRALRPSREGVRVVQAGLGDAAGMIGAATLALDALASARVAEA